MSTPSFPRISGLARRFRRLRRRGARRSQRGVAFVLVLGALTILTVMLTELQDQSSADLASALEARDSVLAEYAAKSAINLSRLLLAAEPTIRKPIEPLLMMMMRGAAPQLPVWEFADRMLGAFNDQAGVEGFSSFAGLDLSHAKNLGLTGAAFEISIVDEDSKLNINAAFANLIAQQRLIGQLMSRMAGPQYNPMFEGRDRDGNFTDRQTVCAAIIDWADSNLDTTLCDPTNTTAQQMPAEDTYYESLKKPFQRKNAAYDSLEELRRVRGVGDDFWATFVDPDPEHPEKRKMTVWGQANAININTASPETLVAMVCGNAAPPLPSICTDPAEMSKFLSVLILARSFMTGVPAFASPDAFISLVNGKSKSPLAPMLEAFGIKPVVFKSEADAKAQMSTESKVFSIFATGIVKAGRRETRTRIHAVIDFRAAPPPGQQVIPPQLAAALQGGLGTGGTSGASAASGTGGSAGTSTGGDTGISGALRPNPGGNVIYYRLD